jgi:hypothetical protein
MAPILDAIAEFGPSLKRPRANKAVKTTPPLKRDEIE